MIEVDKDFATQGAADKTASWKQIIIVPLCYRYFAGNADDRTSVFLPNQLFQMRKAVMAAAMNKAAAPPCNHLINFQQETLLSGNVFHQQKRSKATIFFTASPGVPKVAVKTIVTLKKKKKKHCDSVVFSSLRMIVKYSNKVSQRRSVLCRFAKLDAFKDFRCHEGLYEKD